MKEKLKRQLKEFFKEVTEREASATKEAVKDVKEVVEGLGIRKEIICENDSNAEEKDVATNKEVLAEEATKDVGTVEKESILEDETKEIRSTLFFTFHPWVDACLNLNSLLCPLIYGIRTRKLKFYFLRFIIFLIILLILDRYLRLIFL